MVRLRGSRRAVPSEASSIRLISPTLIQPVSKLQAVSADHDETGALDDEFDTLQCSLEELRTSSAEAEVAADEELVLLMADFIESEVGVRVI